MSKVYDFDSIKKVKKVKKGNRFDVKLFAISLVTYCLGNLGAFVVLIFSRPKGNRFVGFHSAQSMIFFLVAYLIDLALGMFGLLYVPGISLLIEFVKFAFVVFGVVYMSTGRYFNVPYLSDVARSFV